MKRIVTLILLSLTLTGRLQSQNESTLNGYFDTLVDNLGNKYNIKNLRINPNDPGPEQITAATVSCTAGYFKLHFAVGSGFDGNFSPDIDRRNVLCQLFTDLSCLLISPLSSPCNTTTNTTTFVNVHIDATTQNVLGLGAPLFAAPGNANVGATLVDNMAFKTITSGIDGYTNIAGPILTTGSNNFYHILMKFNTGVLWNYNMTTTAMTPGNIDLYTVALHEALHALGFASLMSPNGNSLYAPAQNIYSKYDLRLTNNSFNPLLTSTLPQCISTNLQFNPPSSQINPSNCISSSNSNNTSPTNMCYYLSSTTSMTVPVYTPICFEPGSSLSHFEDQHYPLNPLPPYGNDNYFVMCNSYGGPNGGMKRYPREEEKVVLCDLGYNVAGSYVSPVAGAPYTYTSGACQVPIVYGINDGIVNSTLVFVANGNVISIPTSSILANDSPNAVQADCIRLVYNYPGLSLSVNGGSIQVTQQAGPILYCGVVLIEYVPKNSLGVAGNVTYIYAYFPCGNCNPPNICGLVQNGGFENLINSNFCGGNIANSAPFCWAQYTHTPDLLTSNLACAIPTNQYYIGGNFANSSYSITSTYNGAPNSNAIGMVMQAGTSVTTPLEESVKTDLSTPLVQTQTYVLSFWAFNSKAANNLLGLPSILTFATRQTFAAIPGGPLYPSALDNVIASFTLMPGDFNTWKHYTTTIVYNGPVNEKCLVVGQNPVATTLMNNNAIPNFYYVIIDDVSLQPINNALLFGPPNTVCLNSTITNLNQYSNQPTAVFSGPFVTLNGGSYDFAPTSPGNYSIVASYTNNLGCTYTTQANIVVPSVTITPSNNIFCNYLNYTLTATPIPTNITLAFPTWFPGSINSNSIVVNGGNNTVYQVIATANGCPITAVYTPTIVPNTIVTATPSIWCASPNAAYSMSVSLPNYNLPITVTQTWSPPINSTSNPVSVSFNNNVNPTYTVNTSAGGCTNIATYTATWITQPTIAIIGGTNCLTAGQTVTLQANPSTTLPLTYTWQPGNATTSSIAVTPTAVTIYSLLTSYSNCALTSTLALYPPPQFTNVPASICSGQNYSYLQNLLAPGTPFTGTFTGVGTYTTLVASQILSSFSVSTLSAPGAYPILYSYLTPAGCFATNTLILNVTQGVSLSIPNPTVTYCPNIAVGASVVAIATPSTPTIYTWLPGNINTASFVATPASSTEYSLIASIGTCSATGRVYVAVNNSCCASTNYINTSSISNQTISGLYAINQDLTISGSVVLGGEFLIAPNVSITVLPTATLTSNQGSDGTLGSPVHLRACSNLWGGVYVQNGGKVLFWNGDLIEDAREAIVSTSCSSTSGIDISMIEVAFNRNDVSVAIKNYTQPTNTPPFDISKCVFTCRDLNIPFYSLTWPNAQTLKAASGPTNTLASPYQFAPYLATNLRPPFNTRPSLVGVSVENSGITANPTSTAPIYYAININSDNTANSTNYFDNLVIGISAKNSNVNTFNNIFQNTRRIQLSPNPNSLAGGYGIYAYCENILPTKNTRLNTVTTQSASSLFNIFYNCHYGIYCNNLFELNLQYQDFRSEQSSAVAFNNGLRGQFAIYATGNRFKKYTITNNNFQNIRTCVRIGAIAGALNLPSLPGFGTYLGKITISDNLFSPTIGTVSAPGTGYVNMGVFVDAVLGPNTNPANTFYESGAGLRIEHNNFNKVYRASQVLGFSNSTYNTINAANRVTMVPDVMAPLSSQYGIAHYYNNNDVVNTNTIIGTPITYNQARVSGIYKTSNFNSSTQCNSVVSVYAGFQFDGYNAGAFWRRNIMNSNRRGLQLKTNYLLSVQGTTNSPSDNEWQGSWVGNNGTWTDGTNTTSLSALAIRTFPIKYFPPFPGGPNFSQRYSLSNTLTLIPANNNASFLPCYPVVNPPCTNCFPGIVSTLNSIASNNILYETNPIETDEINKNLTFNSILGEPSLIDSSVILSDFFTSNISSNRGIMRSIESNINQGNLNLVNAIISSFNPNTSIENNNKIFLSIYKNYLFDDSLSSSDKFALFILAHQCPFTDGTVVYEARSLFGIVEKNVDIYTDTYCETLGFSYRGQNDSSSNDTLSIKDQLLYEQLKSYESENQRKFKTITRYDIYPNPAINNISISCTKRTEKVDIRIFDASGKLIVTKGVLINDYKADMNFNLINGIYFVNLINENGEKTIKKLVIVKD